ncbi:MAG: PAS domain S-box protein, partial [Deltaproteobacteria bacterium]|nr:PAS domain S-box protein [Deltaproteobacteria bacterium]
MPLDGLMKDEYKTKRQLIQELVAVRQRFQERAASEDEPILLPEALSAEALKVSDERFRALVEHAPFGLSIMNADRSFEYVNPQFTEMLGYTLEDIPDKETWFRKAYPDEEYREMVKGIWDEDTRQASDAKDVFTRTFRVRAKRGEEKVIRFNKVQLPEGKQFYWYEDITAKMEAEETLRQSEDLKEAYRKYRTLFEASHDAIMLSDKGGIFDGNAAALAMFGFVSKEELVGRHPAEFSPPTQADGRDSYQAANAHTAEGIRKGSHSFEWLMKRKDGTVFPSEVVLRMLALGGRKVLQIIVRDITERKLMEEALVNGSEKIKLFAYSVSHDLKSPAVAVQG